MSLGLLLLKSKIFISALPLNRLTCFKFHLLALPAHSIKSYISLGTRFLHGRHDICDNWHTRIIDQR